MAETSTTVTNGQVSSSNKSLRAFLEGYLKETDILHSKHAVVTLIAVALIILSIVTLILETDREINNRYGTLLTIIDHLIMGIFLLEYVARAYVAAGAPSGETSWKGVWKYIWSFYGIIDFLAILPLFVGIFSPNVHVGYLRVFRLLRILMLGRYLKSFPILRRAISDKKGEILISIQIVAVLTIILSVLMYEIENPVQPKEFSDIATTLGWSISKYIHDIAGTGDFKPATYAGKVLATLIGLLGIAIFAIPAGLVASGFVDEMQDEKKRRDIEKKLGRIEDAFRNIPNEHLGSGKKAPRKYIAMVQAKGQLHLSEQDIITIAELHKGVRLRYKRVSRDDIYPSSLLIEHYDHNRSYGTCHAQKQRSITVISPNSYSETSIGHFSLCLAQALEATFISNELFGGEDCVEQSTACSFSHNEAYYDGEKCRHELEAFKKDISEYVRPGALAIIIRSKTSLKKTGEHESPLIQTLTKQIVSHGIMGPAGLLNLCDGVKKIRVKSSPGSTEDLNEPLVPEVLARGINDLHNYVQQTTNANVLSIYVDNDLLEWTELQDYYRTIKSLADEVGNHVMQRHTPITVLMNAARANGTEIMLSNGTAGIK